MSNVCTFTFDQFNESLLNKSIRLLKKNHSELICLFIASEYQFKCVCSQNGHLGIVATHLKGAGGVSIIILIQKYIIKLLYSFSYI